MSGWRYYQKGRYSEWLPIPDGPTVEAKVRKLGATALTVLSLTELVTEDTDTSKQKFKGPWYCDIDCGNRQEAVDSCLEMCERLISYGVEEADLRVYASGTKGFHIVVPYEAYTRGRALVGLPYIYAEMAKELYVPGLDFQVYRANRGNCFPLPNVRRDESGGVYKVPVTVRELRNYKEGDYDIWVSSPREVHYPEAVTFASNFQALFETCKKSYSKPQKVSDKVESTQLVQFQEEPPACVNKLIAYDVNEHANFNQAAMQMASFVARAGVDPQVWNPLVNLMAEHAHSTKYDTEVARRRHLQGMISYAQNRPSFNFACGAMRSVVGHSQCKGCPIFEAQEEEFEDGYEDDMGIELHRDGYFLRGEKSDKRLTTFLLAPVVSAYQSTAKGMKIRVGTEFEISARGRVLGNRYMSEESWNSRSSFIKEIEGIGDLSFFGSDIDLQKLKHLIFRDYTDDMSEVIEVFSAGIHHQKINERTIKVYVDGTGSVNKFRINGTHVLAGRVPAPPVLLETALPTQRRELNKVEKALKNLILSNELQVVAPVMGWMCSNHLAPDLRALFGQYPLLQLWGNAESGKTMTASLFSYLSGTDYLDPKESLINLNSTSEWALSSVLSSSTSAVRILDEFNKPLMGQNKYNKLVETLKSGWNGQSMSKGTIRKGVSDVKSRTGANVVEIPIISPICYCSEQPTPVPALQQRSVTVGFNRKFISTPERKKAHKEAAVNRKLLLGLSKAMMLHTLDIETEEVGENLLKWEKRLPLYELGDRPTFGFATALTGLDLLIDTLKELEANRETIDLIEKLQEDYVELLTSSSEEITKDKTWSEIDTVIAEMITMMYLTRDGMDTGLMPGKHYFVSEDRLFIDPIICHALYIKFASRSSNTIVITKVKDFLTLLSQEAYCEEVGAKIPEMGARRITILNIPLMEKKGHSVEYLS